MKFLNNITIKQKIFLYLIGFCSILLIFLWLFQIIFLDNFYKNIKVNNLETNLSTIIKNLDNENFSEIANEISKKDEIFIEIVKPDGTTVFSSNGHEINTISRLPESKKIDLFQNAKENNGELLQYFNINKTEITIDERKFEEQPFAPVRPHMENILSAKIIEKNDGDEVLLILSTVIIPVDSTVNTLRIQLYYITAFMIIISIILAFIISKRISEPIVAINKSAKELAIGNYQITFSGEGYKEIGELSQTMNFAAEELSKVEKLRRELIANVSHDLRTPLTLIAGYAEAMRDLPNENNTENAQVIIDEAKRLNTLVTDMLDLSKFQAGEQKFNFTDFNLTELIKEISSNLSTLVKNQGYTINFYYEKETFVNGDKIRIGQAFYNLLINAVNFTGEDKKVTIIQKIENENVKIEIKDSGKGITDKDLPYIWDRYYKAGENHKRAVIGTGIGLSMVKSIISLHKGSYGVDTIPGSGSTFWFTLKINE